MLNLKQCTGCKKWFSGEDLISDPELEPLGMAFIKGKNAQAFYHFLHHAPDCGTTFLLEADKLKDYIDAPFPSANLMGTDECPLEDTEHKSEATCGGDCVDLYDLATCGVECQHAPYRRFLHKMIRMKQLASGKNRLVDVVMN